MSTDPFLAAIKSRHQALTGDPNAQITEALRSLHAASSGKLSPTAANREIGKVISFLKRLRGDES